MGATLTSATYYMVSCPPCEDVDSWSDEEYDARNDALSGAGFLPRATAILLAWAHNQKWHQGEEVSEITWQFRAVSASCSLVEGSK